MNDVLGQALYDYHFQNAPGKLWIYNRYGPREPMPVATYFRAEDDMTDLEQLALKQCRGTVLDAGAAAGCHALALQQRRIDVTALDISPLAVKVMLARGVRQVIQNNIFDFCDNKFETILLLMNGIGLASTLSRLHKLLLHFKSLLTDNGQLIFDSSDVTYLYEGTMPDHSTYYGEIDYRYTYKKQRTDWFSWLYVDKNTLIKIAGKAGFDTCILYEDDYDQYLAKLTLIKN